MQCPECQFENRENANFCKECGANLEFACSGCGTVYEIGSKFCDECGYSLARDSQIRNTEPTRDGERKHVTVLFSDLSGYTAMSEQLDPEEVKEITSHIFDDVSKIISKYDGFIEKYAGDAVMALFGAIQSHEDDPVRALQAAREIHRLIESISPQYEGKIGNSLNMHTGINTGLVVTGELNLEKGVHGVAGDAINVAARLSSLANAGEILVDRETYSRTEGYFQFDNLQPVQLKGKSQPIDVHRYVAAKKQPQKIHRLHGLRAELIGRKAEMSQLSEAIQNLSLGRGSVFSIIGAAGTGKSRLIEEFKASLNLDSIQWREGNAFAYSQNIPYFPLIDLISKTIHIDESDSPDTVRQKLDSSIDALLGDKENIVPYIGSLYSIDYPEISEIGPEFWKTELQKAMLKVLTALAQRAPTVVCLEDLHWADPSTLELVHFLLSEIRHPVLFLCVYRPTISPFPTHQMEAMAISHREIYLRDLSLSEAQNMVESLLKTNTVPEELQHFIRSKVEGNPFYLEEAVNSLIESDILISENGNWKVNGPIAETDISATIQGVITARVDRLELESKRILQEASVIGRSFYYDILKRISEIKDNIDRSLSGLERFNLIRTKSIEPHLEYIFRHALTQEVVYNGLLKKERREIHKRIAHVIEELFEDRLSEFYETLAVHYTRGESEKKAVDYLLKSGQKSLARFSVSEAHQYFKKAFEILSAKENKYDADGLTILDILNSWGYAYYYLGEIKEFIDLFESHLDLVESVDDKARAGMFYAWFGIAFFMAGKPKDSYKYLKKSLDLGEKSDNKKVIGYAHTWLSFTCGALGYFSEGIEHGKKGQKIAESYPTDPYLFFKSLAGLSLIYIYSGEMQKAFDGAQQLLEYGERTANSRSKVFGHFIYGIGYWAIGDMRSSQKSHEKAVEAALDPAYAQFPKASLGMSYFMDGRLDEAKKVLHSCLDFCEQRFLGMFTIQAQYTLAPVLIAKGQMRQGAKLMQQAQQAMKHNHRKVEYAISEHALGEIYWYMSSGSKPSLSIIAKNVVFLLKNVPSALKKSEMHFNSAIKIFDEIGAKVLLGTSYLRLAQLHLANKKNDLARQAITEAIALFKSCNAKSWLEQANGVLAALQ